MMMVQVVILDGHGKPLKPGDLLTAADLRQAADQARQLIRECERLVSAQKSAQPKGQVPYS